MTRSAITAAQVDQARQALGHLVVEACGTPATNVKVRVNLVESRPHSVSCFAHVENAWQKLPETIDDPKVAELVVEELKRLAAAAHTDDFSLRCHELADRMEVEFKFHRDVLEQQSRDGLESWLYGRLFYEQHGSSQTRREAIRRGPRTDFRG